MTRNAEGNGEPLPLRGAFHVKRTTGMIALVARRGAPRISCIEATPHCFRRTRAQGEGNELAESMHRPESPMPEVVLTGPVPDGPCGVCRSGCDGIEQPRSPSRWSILVWAQRARSRGLASWVPWGIDQSGFRLLIRLRPSPRTTFSGWFLSVLPDLNPRTLGGNWQPREASGHWYLSSVRIRAVRFT